MPKMEKAGQMVHVDYSATDFATYRRQAITGIWIDEEGYVFGFWKKTFVATFHINCNEWYNVAN